LHSLPDINAEKQVFNGGHPNYSQVLSICLSSSYTGSCT